MSTKHVHPLTFFPERVILLLPLIWRYACLPSSRSPAHRRDNSISHTNAAGGLTVTFNLVVDLITNPNRPVVPLADGTGIFNPATGRITTPNGYLTYQRDETVLYDSSTFNNYSMFIPYDQFPADVTEVYPFFNVFHNGQVILAEALSPFTWTGRSSPANQRMRLGGRL
jgi:hypothetical protein